MYKDAEGLDVIDATPQSPPLELDDPSVPDKGQYEINLTFHGDLARDAQRLDLLRVDANYGLLPTIAGHKVPVQLKVEFPVAAATENGAPYTLGVGATELGVKVNFYTDEHRGLSISVYPQVGFAVPGSSGVEKGLADPGQTFTVPVLVSKEFRLLTLVGNGAIEQPVHDAARAATGELGVGVGRPLTRKVAAMMAVNAQSTFDLKRDRLVFLDAGVIHGVRNLIMYAQLGRSVFSEDERAHTYVGLGLKILTQPGQ